MGIWSILVLVCDGKNGGIVPLDLFYKERGEIQECGNYRGGGKVNDNNKVNTMKLGGGL